MYEWRPKHLNTGRPLADDFDEARGNTNMEDGGNGGASLSRGTPVSNSHQRVAIFVDVQNLYYSAKHQYGGRVHYGKLLKAVVAGRNLVRAIAYVVQSGDSDQTNFLHMLTQTGYEVKSKQLKVRPDGSTKGDWDMGIAMDSIVLGDRVDVVAIVSGDGDFVDLVNLLKGRGVRVEVWAFRPSTAEDLIRSSSYFSEINKDLLMVPQASNVPIPPKMNERIPNGLPADC